MVVIDSLLCLLLRERAVNNVKEVGNEYQKSFFIIVHNGDDAGSAITKHDHD